MELPPTDVPEPELGIEPAGFMVEAGIGERVHFLDWGGRRATRASGVVAIHGLGQTAWVWTPIARRLGGDDGPLRFVAMDLRGHGLSDAPTEDGAYELARLADDAVAVAEGSGLLGSGDVKPVLAGHGFGAIVAAEAGRRLGSGCAGVLLVDGGWESLEETTGVDPDEFMRGLDEPPEVMRSLAAFLADRRAFDPTTWDDDHERAARAAIVETHAGRVVPSARPHATEATVRAMFGYDPLATLPAIDAPVVALMASGADADTDVLRRGALEAASAARSAAGRPGIPAHELRGTGHNLMRYRPREVAAAILGLAQ